MARLSSGETAASARSISSGATSSESSATESISAVRCEHGPVASGADPFEYGRHPLADDRRVDLRTAEQIGPLAFLGIHRNSHQRIIFSSDSTRISSAPIALSCSILLHSSRSLITTCIELQPSCASGRIVGLFMPGRMRTASGIFA